MTNNPNLPLDENPSAAQPAAKAQPISGCVDSVMMILIGFGLAFIAYLRHISILGTTFAPETAPRTAAWIGIGLQAFIFSVVLVPLALFWPSPRRRTYQAWLVIHLMTMVLSIGFLFPPAAIQSQTVFQILVGIAILPLVLTAFRRFPSFHHPDHTPAQSEMVKSNSSSSSSPRQLWLVVGMIIIASSFPWLAIGALGSLLDTVLMLILSFVFGSITALSIVTFLSNPDRLGQRENWSEIFQNGLAASVLCVLAGSSFSFSFGSIQLVMMLSLPIIGWIFVLLNEIFHHFRTIPPSSLKLKEFYRSFSPFIFLVGSIIAFPLLFLDPDELIIVLSSQAGEILTWAFQAAALNALGLFLAVLILVIALVFARRKPPERSQLPPSKEQLATFSLGFLLIITLVIAVSIYSAVGQPGFHGERMFVILKDQADLSAVPESGDYSERRQIAYELMVKHANENQKEIRAVLSRFRVDYTPYYLINGLDVEGNFLVKLWLLRRPEVDRILENPVLRPLPRSLPVETGPLGFSPQDTWNLSMIGADRVWEEFGVRGAGIVIGQSDSGVQGDHPELADSYRGRQGSHDYNWLDPWNHSTAPVDIGGHGTHTLGTILGNRTGVAPDAVWIGCVNLARNLGNPGYYLDCMQFSFAPYPQNGDSLADGDPSVGAHILNNSWGCPPIEGCDANLFLPAVQALRRAGVFVVASAGNDGPACESLNVPPPIYSEVFSVGAVDRSGNLAPFSSIGPVTIDQSGRIKPDLVAPGVEILSSLPEGTYGRYSGTSMAGPHVAGTVALMWSANPALIGNIDLTEELLIESADPYQGFLPQCSGAENFPSTATGYGLLDAYEAVKLARETK